MEVVELKNVSSPMLGSEVIVLDDEFVFHLPSRTSLKHATATSDVHPTPDVSSQRDYRRDGPTSDISQCSKTASFFGIGSSCRTVTDLLIWAWYSSPTLSRAVTQWSAALDDPPADDRYVVCRKSHGSVDSANFLVSATKRNPQAVYAPGVS
jgi:hypothetical protein